MGKLCKKCGMESEQDDICTWCNADLKTERPTASPTATAGSAEKTPPAAAHRPATRPTSSAAPQKSSGMAWQWPVIAAVVAAALLAYPLFIHGIRINTPPPEPGEWKTFTARDKSFGAAYPAGWGEPSNSGASGSYVLVEWKAGKLCKVQVKGSQTAGAVGDAAAVKERAAMGAGIPLTIDKTADGALFDYFNKAGEFAKTRPGYEEGAPQEAHHFGGVRAAFSEYTYNRRIGLISLKMKGMRWASFQGDYGYHVWAEAPEQHWDKFKPVVEQILASVKLGKAS